MKTVAHVTCAVVDKYQEVALQAAQDFDDLDYRALRTSHLLGDWIQNQTRLAEFGICSVRLMRVPDCEEPTFKILVSNTLDYTHVWIIATLRKDFTHDVHISACDEHLHNQIQQLRENHASTT